MDPIKEAFNRIKEDIYSLSNEISLIRTELQQLKLQQLTQIPQQSIPLTPTMPVYLTNKPTDELNTTSPSTNLNQEFNLISHTNTSSSTGNRGVPTDKPTNQQTNQQTNNAPQKFAQDNNQYLPDDFQKAQQVLNSLDNIKKGIRLKFKRLTPQEMAVFSTLYTLEEQKIDEITYKIIANNLNLSESSIREYTNKLVNKGIPIIKIRHNNKKITLSISPDLKNIASLSAIIQLREI